MYTLGAPNSGTTALGVTGYTFQSAGGPGPVSNNATTGQTMTYSEGLFGPLGLNYFDPNPSNAIDTLKTSGYTYSQEHVLGNLLGIEPRRVDSATGPDRRPPAMFRFPANGLAVPARSWILASREGPPTMARTTYWADRRQLTQARTWTTQRTRSCRSRAVSVLAATALVGLGLATLRKKYRRP